LAEKMLYGEVGPGQIVLVDVDDGEGAAASFTFVGTHRGEIPEAPPLETVGSADDRDTDGPVDLPRAESSE
ncbi:MAG: hypothetical protein ABI873_09960, partial [Marmoricola sp.]